MSTAHWLSTSTPGMEGLDLSQTVGVVYWGFLVSTILLGVTVIQGFMYYSNNQDKLPLRLFVTTLILLDVASSCLTSHLLHYQLIQNYGNTYALSHDPSSFFVEYVVTSFVAFLWVSTCAQTIILLTKSPPNSFRTLTKLRSQGLFAVAGLAAMAVVYRDSLLFEPVDTKRFEVTTGLASSFAAVSDLLACSSLCIFLASHRTELDRGRTLIHTLLFYTVNRGMFFAIAQIGRLIAYLCSPYALYWVPFHLCLSKLHVNCLCALNSRESLRAALQEASRISFRVDPLSTTTDASQLDTGRLELETGPSKSFELRRLKDCAKASRAQPHPSFDSSSLGHSDPSARLSKACRKPGVFVDDVGAR
ncbi:hypothetical protein DFH11DRAFT_1636560 [Phellopilus nigrolimitatus]|nr:hypothetical protein DFH11DRAFT_1636560 [Phellopilus nigrolimitatus]